MSSPLSPTKQALQALQQLQSKLDALEAATREPIAIVGVGCRYPGASDADAFWELLCTGGDGLGDAPRDRWDADALYSADASRPGTIVARRGGFIEGLDRFDAGFFGISPREAPHVDPRQRLMLEVAWEALEHAGIPPDSLATSRTGVFVATLTNDYDHLLFGELTRADAFSGAGTANSVVANRISYFLDLHGPSIALDTACSGSLVAVHLACESLRSGESTLALAGGVSVNLMVKSNVFFSRAGALSPGGRCRTFDAGADGMVRSDGAGIIVLKTLSQAQRDGDRVIAVIAGSAVNHDGRSNGIMAPNGEAQKAVVAEAYRRAGIAPGHVQYVEAHGTATRIGDPIEVQALGAVLTRDRPAGLRCVLGSLKTNVGHSEAAAGVAGIIKTALALHHRHLPPTIHFEQPNPLLGIERLPFDVRTEGGTWPDESRPLVAGVSGFGFGGTNAHIVLRQATPAAHHDAPARGPLVLPLSARTPRALAALATRVRDQLASGQVQVSDACRTAAVHRMHHGERLAIVAADGPSLVSELDRRIPGVTGTQRSAGRGAPPRVAFVFSGQGSHWCGMAADLLADEPVFARVFAECDRLVRERTGRSIAEAVQGCGGDLDRTELAQPAIFAAQVALAALWQSWGVTPAAVIGHSLGEAAAAHVCGALSLEDAVQVVCERSRLMALTAGAGATAVLGLSLDDARRALRTIAGDVVVAGANASATTVVSGDPAGIDALVARMAADGVFCRRIPGVDIAFHSPQMDPLRPHLESALQDIRPRDAVVPIFSTVTSEEMDGRAFGAEYWGRNLREPFLFAQATRAVIDAGCTVLLEVSPHAVLGSAALQTIRDTGAANVRVLSSMRRDTAGVDTMLASLAALYELEAPVDWREVFRHRGGRRASLPSYPWQRQRYWYDQLGTDPIRTDRARHAAAHPLLGVRVDVAPVDGDTSRVVWDVDVNAGRPAYIADHRVEGAIVWPAAAALEMAHAAACEQWPGARIEVADATFERPLVVPSAGDVRLQCSLTLEGDEGSFALFARAAGDARLPWQRYVTATVRRGSDADAGSTCALDAIRHRCPEVMAVDDHYRALAAQGLEYGERFRTIVELYRGDGEVLARLRGTIEQHETYAVHPAVLDAALQSVAAVADTGSADTRYLPYSVRRWHVYTSIDGEVWCHARLHGRPGDARLEAHITLVDADGRVCAELAGLELRRAPTPRRESEDQGTNVPGARRVSSDPAQWLIREQWLPRPLPAASSRPIAGHWLILSDRSGVGDHLARELAAGGARACLVHHGPSYRRLGTTRFQVRADRREDLARVLEALDGPVTGAIHLWAFDTTGADDGSVDTGVSLTTTSALHLAQVLLARPAQPGPSVHTRGEDGAPCSLWLVTRGGVAVGPGHVAVTHAPLSGLSLVIAQEHPELSCRLVDLPIEGAARNAETLAAELRSHDREPRVAWRNGTRHVARLARVADADAVAGGAMIRGDRTYLLTGGLGALGLDTARALVDAGARHLLLLSRRALDAAAPGAREAVSQIASRGVTVTVAAVDVADDGVHQALDSALAGMPALAGVVHAAGILDDGPIAQLTDERFARVMRPKVRGTWNLHRYTADKALDFFVCYSSAASLIGSAGQANYAAANAFMDAVVHHRRTIGLPAVAINWGAWASGMGGTGRLAARFASRGMAAIDSAAGVRIAMRALGATPLARFGVLPVDWPVFVRQFAGDVPPLFEELAGATATLSAPAWRDRLSGVAPGERRRLLRTWIRDELAGVLGFSVPGEIGPGDRFFDLGMDSLTAVELRNRLQARAGVALAATLAFDHGCVDDVAAHIELLLDDRSTAPEDARADVLDTTDLDTMTDEELALALARELDEDPA